MQIVSVMLDCRVAEAGVDPALLQVKRPHWGNTKDMSLHGV